jgi:hypothetical protein
MSQWLVSPFSHQVTKYANSRFLETSRQKSTFTSSQVQVPPHFALDGGEKNPAKPKVSTGCQPQAILIENCHKQKENRLQPVMLRMPSSALMCDGGFVAPFNSIPD